MTSAARYTVNSNSVRARSVHTVLAVLCLAGVALSTAAPAHAQRLVKIGALTEGFGPTPWMLGLREGLVELGYQERRDFVIGLRFTQGNADDLVRAAREFVEQKVDLLVVGGGPSMRAALAATSEIPIVLIGGGDPVALGLVKSYARPGGNATGITTLDIELAPKRLEMLRDVVPGLRKVVFVYDASDSYTALELKGLRAAASQLGLTLLEHPVRTREEARAQFRSLRRTDAQGILAPWAMSLNVPGFALEASQRLQLAAMFPEPFWVEQGALASYSADHHVSGRQAARLVDKILRGTPPGDIPFEVDNHIHFALNLKAARALGLTIPSAAILRANRVIQ